ncbi:PEP-CTERM sorting domain-containing protein [Puniceicoccus vermicola]|uniref:PEP-CTERM sorting domain-containing protein n=1 Tax=Puniceicoccus vermicola TaxID=388746 RepID=A0A7X1AZD5_9BACT|nr:PEP-CTERM sorting domain-containing protein [Puniceicoccus vermicola]MBC2602786.1 PEP-CTERM sorting domain-containing protein [Puniceicoccus vermicola]
MKLLLPLGLLALTTQFASAASINFIGRTDLASAAAFDLTEIGTTDWAYWDSAVTTSPGVSGTATNEMDGGFGIGSISVSGIGSYLRGTSGFAINTEFSFSNGSGVESGTEAGVTGLFSEELATAGEGVQLDITLAEAGQEYVINIWTGGFATQFATVVGSMNGAESYTSGNTGGSGFGGAYGDSASPREPYLYTFNVIADNPNEVFNFSIATAGTQSSSSHVLIAAASIAAVPEPGTYALLAGFCMLGFVMMRRRSYR